MFLSSFLRYKMDCGGAINTLNKVELQLFSITLTLSVFLYENCQQSAVNERRPQSIYGHD